MIYLDYSATTPVDPEALEAYVRATREFPGNANSAHLPGRQAALRINQASREILRLLDIPDREIVYTSGATEANNLALKGAALRRANQGRHLITTAFEHSSVTASFGWLQTQGFEVDFLETDALGQVSLDSLAELIRPDTILVSVGALNGEIGIRQPLGEIGSLLRYHPYIVFHSDVTQALGKIPLSLESVDLASFSAHKFYGPKGIGALVRKKEILLDVQIHGGRSTTDLRSGTPALPLIVAMETALRGTLAEADMGQVRVATLRRRLLRGISGIPGIVSNSGEECAPHIVNLSVLSRDSEKMVEILDSKGICVSSQTACHAGGGRSDAVFRLTGDERRARTSLRVSLSPRTTEEEVDALVAALREEGPR